MNVRPNEDQSIMSHQSRHFIAAGLRSAGSITVAALLLAMSHSSLAQEWDESFLDAAAHAAEQWARENLDESIIAAAESGAREGVEKAVAAIQKEFGGEYVLDLALLKPGITALLPLLDRYEETVAYSQWLKTRLDYLDIAEEFKAVQPVPDPAKPGVRENPSAPKQREAWLKKVRQRPWPEQARDLVPQLKPVFQAEEVAPELVWIAEVESSFDPKAKSPAGAVGLFQLMPATAQRFGLSTSPKDDREQPRKSARASAKYLKFLHTKFKDWRLALAAYNCGEGTVQKLLERHKAKSFDEIAPHLPAETQMYVPKVEATLQRREGLSLAQLRSSERAG